MSGDLGAVVIDGARYPVESLRWAATGATLVVRTVVPFTLESLDFWKRVDNIHWDLHTPDGTLVTSGGVSMENLDLAERQEFFRVGDALYLNLNLQLHRFASGGSAVL